MHKRRFLVIVLLIFVILGVAGFSILNSNIVKKTEKLNIAMHTYTDQDGYFTIRIPNSWNVYHQLGGGTLSFDNNKTFHTYTSEEFVFGNFTTNHVFNSGTVRLYVEVWRGLCVSSSTEWETTLNGFPAHFDGNSMWTLANSRAVYKLNESFPGIKEADHTELEVNPGGPIMMLPATPLPTPTSVPAKIFLDNKKLVDGVLSTFMPIPNTGRACIRS